MFQKTIPQVSKRIKKFQTACPVCGKELEARLETFHGHQIYTCDTAGVMRAHGQRYFVCFSCSRIIHSEAEFLGTLAQVEEKGFIAKV